MLVGENVIKLKLLTGVNVGWAGMWKTWVCDCEVWGGWVYTSVYLDELEMSDKNQCLPPQDASS